MTKTLAAMSEIIRVGGWALRGLGYPFGVAERGVRLVAWAEAAHGDAIKRLRMAEPLLAETIGTGIPRRYRDDAGAWSVDGLGKHLLEVGPPAIDLLTSDARQTGSGRLALDNVIGHDFLATLVDLTARRRLACVAAYTTAPFEPMPDELAASGWIIAVPGSESTRFMTADTDWHPPSGFEFLHSGLNARFASESGNRVSVGRVRFAAFRRDTPEFAELSKMGQSDELAVVDFDGRLADAYRSGVVIGQADLDYLYALERRTWAPTSERSRAQAGYGVY